MLKETFPDIRRVVNPRAQFEQRLRGLDLGGAEGHHLFLQMLGVLGTVLAEIPGTIIESLSFRNEVMSLQLRASNVETLDRIKQKLEEGGLFEAEIQSATQGDEAIEGRMQLQFYTRGPHGLLPDGPPVTLLQGQTGYVRANRIHDAKYVEDCKLVYVHNRAFGFQAEG